MTDAGMIAALLRERDAYFTRPGMAHRVAEVDEQLKIRGYDVSTLPQREAGNLRLDVAPKARRAPGRQRA